MKMFGRNQDKQNDHGSDESQVITREPLEWREVEKIQHGYAIGGINSAERADGSRIYSWSLGKEGRRDDRVMKFLDPRDISDAHKVLDDVAGWITDERAADREEMEKQADHAESGA